jgi:hypothetical protein
MFDRHVRLMGVGFVTALGASLKAGKWWLYVMVRCQGFM